MSRIAAIVLPVLITLSSYGSGLVLRGTPFNAGAAQIIWAAPTNHLPRALWVYKVVPQTLAPTIISNALAVASFTPKNRARPQVSGFPYGHKEMMHFRNKEQSRYLNIFPDSGWIEYYDGKVRVQGKDRVSGVPTEQEALALAFGYLHKLGIDRSQLAVKPDTCELRVYRDRRERTRLDKARNETAKEVISRGVYFVRRIDGVDFTGLASDAGFMVNFGNDARVAALEMVWRNLQPHRSCSLASPGQIINMIKHGRAVAMEPLSFDTAKISKIQINKITPYYLGESGDKPQDFVFPFAALESTVDAEGKDVSIHLNVPILQSDELE